MQSTGIFLEENLDLTAGGMSRVSAGQEDLVEIPLGACSVEGCLDGLLDGRVRGWAWFPADSETRCAVDFVSDGVVVASTHADLFRDDLKAAGKRAGHCAFELGLEQIPSIAGGLSAQIRRGQTAVELPGSPISPEMLEKARASRKGNIARLPQPLASVDVIGSLDVFSSNQVRGWVHFIEGAERCVALSFWTDGRSVFRLEAKLWRNDLADLRDGNGCCGFEGRLPKELCDGEIHEFDVRSDHDGRSLLLRPFRVRLKSVRRCETPSGAGPVASKVLAPINQDRVPSEVGFSIIVNFYNMQREAARTLTSLSRAYQQGIGDASFEVICIDNGSSPPLDAEWVRSFGPEFSLLVPSQFHGSPCVAINEAVATARGAFVAIMIDGAHVLTPGVYREVLDAIAEDSEVIVAVRHWFIGGDQRWLSAVGYTREMEDRLFERIRWPVDGYQMFLIGAPIGEGAEPWVDGIAESNCLFMPTKLYDQIGGMDASFLEAGGGFSNLDLLRRAHDQAAGGIVALVGEATFHQFHGGTTTNVDDHEKDRRVRAYSNSYRKVRGESFAGVSPEYLRLRGTVRTEKAVGVRQRSLLPMRMGVTDKVRPINPEVLFDGGMRLYLQATYAEAALQRKSIWNGLPVAVSPADLISIQQIIRQTAPECIVVTGAEIGLVAFLDSILGMLGHEHARLIAVDPVGELQVLSPRVRLLANGGQALCVIRDAMGAVETTMVLFSPDKDDNYPVAALHAYGELVSLRCHLVFLGSVFGQPWLGYSNRRYLAAIREFVKTAPFVIEDVWTQHLITTSPYGYMRRTKAWGSESFDASLDILDNY